MDISIFDFQRYKPYLKALMRSNPSYGHGFKSKMAKAVGCQTAYLSQVLHKDVNFSLEQAEEVNLLLGHNKLESRYFLLLVQLERAGSTKLQARLQTELSDMLERREHLKERVEKTPTLSNEKQMRYYSHWYYSAIHIMTTISEYNSKEAIAEGLRLNINIVKDVLEFLQDCGLLTVESGAFRPGNTRLFLTNDSPMISKLHSNWRMRAIESLDWQVPSDLHYSSVVSLSRDDFGKIKERLIQIINEVRSQVRVSKEETLANFNIDFFGLLKN